MFRAKQTKFEPLSARKCQKRKNNSQNHYLVRNLQHMTIVFDSNLFHNIYLIVVCAMFRAKQTKYEPYYARKCLKRKTKSQKYNLARNGQHMTIVFNSNLFHTIIYTKQCCVPCFVPNKPLYARKCQIRLKKLQNATYHVILSTCLMFSILTISAQ